MQIHGRFVSRARRSRRGSAILVAMGFMIMATSMGLGFLAVTGQHMMQTATKGINTKLLHAAEAGIESKRGRFKLVAGIQDDWSALLPLAGWNQIDGPININGVVVQVEARPFGTSSVPKVSIRGIAVSGLHKLAVEYDIKVAAFSDYARYNGSGSTSNIGTNFKMYGTYYCVGNLNLANRSGIEFFGNVFTEGVVQNVPDWPYNFKEDVQQNVDPVVIPPSAYGFGVMKTVAQGFNTLFYSNTTEIELMGTVFRRRYWFQPAAGPAVLMNETLGIPEEGVIYIVDGQPPVGFDATPGQQVPSGSCSNDTNLWGWLFDRRVTIASERDFRIVDNVTYKACMDDPSLREPTNKKSAAALGFKEMLGVISAKNVLFICNQITPVPSAYEVSGGLGNQYQTDGVFMGVQWCKGQTNQNSNGKEWWGYGCLIGQGTTGLAGRYQIRHYDWDWRLESTTPPYFMKAYNTSATFLSGTWRTYPMP